MSKMRIALGSLLCGIVLCGAARAQHGAIRIESTFSGPTGDPDASYRDHPDLVVAACSHCGANGQVMVATGQDVTIYDTHGTVLKKQTLKEFITAAGAPLGQINDPRGTYDPFIRRWILVCTCAQDSLMVSASDDATGAWKGVVMSGAAGDYTMFPGFDKNGVYVSEFQPKLNARVMALPARDVAWTGSGTISLAHEAIFDQQPFEMRPAIDRDTKKKPDAPEFLVSRVGPPQNATNLPLELLVDRITWKDGKAKIAGPQKIPTGFLYNTPIVAPQTSGPDIRGNESHRIFGIDAYRGHLYFVQSSGPCAADCGEQGTDPNDLFYFFDLNTKTMALDQKTKVADSTLSFLFPSIAVDAEGNVGIGVMGTAKTQHPSVYVYTHLASDVAGAMHGPFLAKAGTADFKCGKRPAYKINVVGWGTYSATIADGSNPDELWTAQEFGGDATACVWTTQVTGFAIKH